MFEEAKVEHPLDVLTEIENTAAVDQDLLLKENGTPWAELLANYVDVLSDLAVHGSATNGPTNGYTVRYGLDEGHAGGCGRG
ncbi:hypothetical protein F7Q99_11910 [Streptomyces kaniharaensis]|uniref:Uncharacterized protein n=1 Tax=Streptomyces kaniharaensis TaxID=212423 RepID=A0A6N7KRM8_9ACTN|nr:DUF6269 family protein [Streptomyces kaniharaensis]MQS12977.1 hypothetical protein [Streptomyces kaniharaensis]